jgi:hypothetical protein
MSPMAANPTHPSDIEPEPERRTQFRDLIRRRRAELNESLDVFARKAVDPVSGVQVKRGWINRLETGQPVTPPAPRRPWPTCTSSTDCLRISGRGFCASLTRWCRRTSRASKESAPHCVTQRDDR